MTDPLQHLLKQTDREAAPLPIAPSDLSAHLRRTLKRRRTTRRILTMATPIVLLTIVFIPTMFRQSPMQQATRNMPQAAPPKPGALPVQDEIAAIESHLSLLESSERLARAESKLASLTVLASDNSATERAAASILFRANRLAEQPSLHVDAAQAYHDVIRAFPDTVSADTARRKLAQLQKENPV